MSGDEDCHAESSVCDEAWEITLRHGFIFWMFELHSSWCAAMVACCPWPRQEQGNWFHADSRWWIKGWNAAHPVPISATDLGLSCSQRRGTRIYGVPLSSFVVHISCMGGMSCSLNPINCIDRISTECRGIWGELLSLAVGVCMCLHPGCHHTSFRLIALSVAWRQHCFLCKVSCGTNPGSAWTTEEL